MDDEAAYVMPEAQPASPKILIVDDEEDILDLLQYNLSREDFETVVARDGEEALAKADEERPDLIILDIMMPKMDGLEVCRRLRQDAELRTIPILMLTARAEEGDHVRGLDDGADIYLAKPISIPVLLSQTKALLRGARRSETPPERLVVRDLEINRDRYLVFREGQGEAVRLPRKEFELLYYLASQPGKVFTRQDLLDAIWGPDVYVVDRTVDVHVRKIREKLGSDYIETIKGVGYKFKK